jgi:SRSO17 transposase
VAKSHRVITCAPLGPQRVDQIAAQLPRRSWNRRSAGQGSKGDRDYDWAWISLVAVEAEAAAGGQHHLLIRRGRTDGELAYYRCWSPAPVHLRDLVKVAGTRWSIETCFQTGKGLGLDEHQVGRWDSWYRHTTLVMLAHAILTVIAACERAQQQSVDDQLIPLSINEIRRLLARLVINAAHTIDHWLGWSQWRRRHQKRAKTSHYKRREQLEHRAAPT